MRRRGLTYAYWITQGYYVPVVDVQIRYFQPTRLDDLLIHQTTLIEVKQAFLLLRCQSHPEQQLLVRDSTRLAYIGHTYTVRQIDDMLMATLLSAEATAAPHAHGSLMTL
ncbi:hypothetical protein [Pajaroellobacter abortibovis]|uniref:Thioesterase domain-containing protein n=1 Tax=Pajaroellobacter abortibovis TaxID=1882918 RepID=A0A1L6MYW7_9BACT|nr:hypothetical protein [Pajaroellobacter abortibovis]APS00575.1 hypothetical protein BCY86_07730 [Pajaroellobacter abortibovis]